MAESLTQRLTPFAEQKWFANNPPAGGEVAAAEAALQHQFPADYRELLQAGGGEIHGDNAVIYLYPPEHLTQFNPGIGREELRPMLVVGDDMGDFVYFYDPDDRIGRGAWSMHAVPKGSPLLKYARYVGRTLTHAVDRIFAGDDVLDPTVS